MLAPARGRQPNSRDFLRMTFTPLKKNIYPGSIQNLEENQVFLTVRAGKWCKGIIKDNGTSPTTKTC
jgi:hypothetical protein